MVKMQLPGAKPSSADAADALAIALCHAFHAQTAGRFAAALEAGK
jgi:crossover junction endodeoxyribonuclease RuvC